MSDSSPRSSEHVYIIHEGERYYREDVVLRAMESSTTRSFPLEDRIMMLRKCVVRNVFREVHGDEWKGEINDYYT